MKKKEPLRLEQDQKFKDFPAEEIRAISPEIRFRQLRTMFATAHLPQSDSEREAEKAEVRELWRLLKERFNASI